MLGLIVSALLAGLGLVLLLLVMMGFIGGMVVGWVVKVLLVVMMVRSDSAVVVRLFD